MVRLRQNAIGAIGGGIAGILLASQLCSPVWSFEPPATVDVPAGPFVAGSDWAERDYGYQLDETAYGHDRTRAAGWYERESPRGIASTGTFAITRTPITNGDYAAFVTETDHPAPEVNEAIWSDYRLVHPFERTRRHAWTDGRPPQGRENHPVVLVSHGDALAYAAWLSRRTGQSWRLPSELEWEKAARGTDGRYFPWGDRFEADRLNSHDRGPFDTMPVSLFPTGARPLWRPRHGGAGLPMDVHNGRGGSLCRQRRLVGRQGLRHLSRGGSAQPAGCAEAYPNRLSPGEAIETP